MRTQLRKKVDEASAKPRQHALPQQREQHELPELLRKPEQHGKRALPVQHVYPVSNGHRNGQSEFPLSEGHKAELMALARRNACTATTGSTRRSRRRTTRPRPL